MESTITTTSARPTLSNKAMRPRFNPPVYSSSSSSSFNSSGEMQYVDPDSGEPFSGDYHLPQQPMTSSQTPVAEELSSEDHPDQDSQSSRRAFARRRNPEPEDERITTTTSDMQVDTSSNSSNRAATAPASLQPVDPPDPPNFYHRDMDFEVQLISLRNKRVLMARLVEVVPRGRLSLVRSLVLHDQGFVEQNSIIESNNGSPYALTFF